METKSLSEFRKLRLKLDFEINEMFPETPITPLEKDHLQYNLAAASSMKTLNIFHCQSCRADVKHMMNVFSPFSFFLKITVDDVLCLRSMIFKLIRHFLGKRHLQVTGINLC